MITEVDVFEFQEGFSVVNPRGNHRFKMGSWFLFRALHDDLGRKLDLVKVYYIQHSVGIPFVDGLAFFQIQDNIWMYG